MTLKNGGVLPPAPLLKFIRPFIFNARAAKESAMKYFIIILKVCQILSMTILSMKKEQGRKERAENLSFSTLPYFFRNLNR